MKNRAVTYLILLLLLTGVTSGCTDPLLEAPAATPSLTGKIAFTANLERSGDFHLYVMNADGTGLTRLTDGQRKDFNPSWSPDGKKIAFSSLINGQDDIYIINADGSGETRLTDNPFTDLCPAWSNDGEKILFVSTRDSSDPSSYIYELYVMDADGSNQTRLTYYEAHCSSPSWSPDGSRIIISFDSDAMRNVGIYSIKSDGTDLIRIIYDEEQSDTEASLSPDGSRIVFRSLRPDYNTKSLVHGIFVSQADGTNQVMISNPDYGDVSPSWSPDGRMIVFVSPRDSDESGYPQHLYVMNADGSNPTRLTEQSALYQDPAWSY